MISSILLVVLFIGVLITFHEFGHLIVAKLTHIPVETFSIGFGPPLLKKKWGETEYRLAVFPLGGYIKMVGEEDPEAKGFNDRSFKVRAAVIAAGPVSNLLLGFLMILVMYLVFGVSYTAPVADPKPDSPAAVAGLLPGDLVVAAAGETIPSFEVLEGILQRNAGNSIDITVTRDGQRLSFSFAVPAAYGGTQTIPVIGRVRPDGPADRIGLEAGDTIVSVAGNPIKTWSELAAAIRKQDGDEFQIQWRHGEELCSDSVVAAVRTDPQTGKGTREIGVEADLSWYLDPLIAPVVGRVRKGGPAAHVGLHPGDTIIGVAGKSIHRWDEFVENVSGHGGERLAISWRRNGKTITDSVAVAVETDQLTGEKIGQIGITVSLPRKQLMLHTAAWEALRRSGYVVVQTFVIIYKVITRQIATKAIGGPIMVAKVAYEGANWGGEYFVALWALLSINLFVVNMLPVPVLDGGRILLFAFEGLRRRKLTEKEMTWAMNIGWIIIGAMVVLTVFNDVLRLLKK